MGGAVTSSCAPLGYNPFEFSYTPHYEFSLRMQSLRCPNLPNLVDQKLNCLLSVYEKGSDKVMESKQLTLTSSPDDDELRSYLWKGDWSVSVEKVKETRVMIQIGYQDNHSKYNATAPYPCTWTLDITIPDRPTGMFVTAQGEVDNQLPEITLLIGFREEDRNAAQLPRIGNEKYPLLFRKPMLKYTDRFNLQDEKMNLYLARTAYLGVGPKTSSVNKKNVKKNCSKRKKEFNQVIRYKDEFLPPRISGILSGDVDLPAIGNARRKIMKEQVSEEETRVDSGEENDIEDEMAGEEKQEVVCAEDEEEQVSDGESVDQEHSEDELDASIAGEEMIYGGLSDALFEKHLVLLQFIEDEKTDTQGFLAISEDATELNIVLRGSTTKQDWKENIRISFRTWKRDKNCKVRPRSKDKLRVHFGWQRQFRSLWKAMVKNLDLLLGNKDIPKNVDRIRRVNIVGHSLGGALATLVFIRVIERYLSQSVLGATQPFSIELHTYGAPRPMNKAMKSWFVQLTKPLQKVKAFRIVNDNDPAPKVPLRSMGYCHVGEYVILTDNVPDYLYPFLDDAFKTGANHFLTGDNSYKENIVRAIVTLQGNMHTYGKKFVKQGLFGISPDTEAL